MLSPAPSASGSSGAPTPSAPPPSAPAPAPEKLPVREKIAYGVGDIGGTMPKMAEIHFFNPIFVVMFQLSPGLLSLLGLGFRLWDAITDLLMGWVSDNTRTRWGRRRPYIFLGAILSAAWMPVIWLLNPAWPVSTIIAWMIGCQLVLYLVTTIWNIPYQCLLIELTTDSTERTNVAAYRSFVSFLPWLAMSWSWYLAQLPVFGPGDGSSDLLNGAFWVTCLASVFVLIAGIMPALGCRERGYAEASKRKRTSIRRDVRLTLSSRPFLLLCAFAMLFWIGSQACGGLGFYTKLYYVCDGDQKLAAKLSAIQTSIVMIVGLAGLPLFTWVARRFGKRNALISIAALVALASLSTFFTYRPDLPYLSIVSGVLLAPTNSVVWAILPSLMGDCVDYDELANGQRREGSFSAVYSWFFKVAMSISAGLSGFLVMMTGFDQKLPEQSDSVILAMRLTYIIAPFVVLGIAIYVMWRFPLTSPRIAEIRAQLDARERTVAA